MGYLELQVTKQLSVNPIEIASHTVVLTTMNRPHRKNIFTSKTPYISAKDFAISGFSGQGSIGKVETFASRVFQPLVYSNLAFKGGILIGSAITVVLE
jgi:hypothetical protein